MSAAAPLSRRGFDLVRNHRFKLAFLAITFVAAGGILRARALLVVAMVFAALTIVLYVVAHRRERRWLSNRSISLHDKLYAIRTMPQQVFVGVGATYLDVNLDGVGTSRLDEDEWITLSSIRAQLGGSAFRFAKALASDGECTCRLFTVVGGDLRDPLTQLMHDAISCESWLREEDINRYPDAKAAVTVVLNRHDAHESRTMFTHRGPLEHLGWELVDDRLVDALSPSGGVLYIGGYFKTNLSDRLTETLERLRGRHVGVVVDHGMLPAERDFQYKLDPLRHAFRRGLVDVYMCTYRELFGLLNTRVPTANALRHIRLRIVARRFALELPTITVVRDARDTHIVHEGRVFSVKSLPRGELPPEGFNPRFVKAFFQLAEASIMDHARRCAHDALWRRT